MNPAKSKKSAKMVISSNGIKFATKLHRNNSVTEDSMASKNRNNGVIKTNGMYPTSTSKFSNRQDTRSDNQPSRNLGKTVRDIVIKNVKSKNKIVSYIKPKQSSKKVPERLLKDQSSEQKCSYLTKRSLSNYNISQNNLYLSENTSVSIDKNKKEDEIENLFLHTSFNKKHSQSDTILNYCASYEDKNSINSKRKSCDGMQNNKKVRFEKLPRDDLKIDTETNFATTKEMVKGENINKPLKPILKAETFQNSEELLVPFTDEKDKKDAYHYKVKTVQMSNQNCVETEGNLSSESFNQSQIMHKSSENIVDNVNLHALSANNFKDERQSENLYAKIEMSEFGTKIKQLQHSRSETFEKEINNKVELLNDTFLEEIKKDISCEEENKENPTKNCHKHSKELAANFEDLEISNIKCDNDNNIYPDIIETVNHSSDNTSLNCFNKSFSGPENIINASPAASRIPRLIYNDISKDSTKLLNKASPDQNKIISVHDSGTENCTENTPSRFSRIPRFIPNIQNDISEKIKKAFTTNTSSNFYNKIDFTSPDSTKQTPQIYSRIPRYYHPQNSTDDIESVHQDSYSCHQNYFETNDFHDTKSHENESSSQNVQFIQVIQCSQLNINSDVSSTNLKTDSGKSTFEIASPGKINPEPPSNFQTEKYPTLAETTESFVCSEKISSRKKTTSFENKLVGCNELLDEEDEVIDIFNIPLKNEPNTVSQELRSSHYENATDDVHVSSLPRNYNSNAGSNVQDVAATYNNGTPKSTKRVDKQLSESLDLQSTMIHASPMSSNEDVEQELQKIIKEMLKDRNETRTSVRNHRRAILIMFLLMIFELLIHVLVYA